MNVHVKEFADGDATLSLGAEPAAAAHAPMSGGRALAYVAVIGVGGSIGLIVGVVAAGMLGLITIGC